MVLGIHDYLIGDLFYCVVLYGGMESDLYQTNYPPHYCIRAVIAGASPLKMNFVVSVGLHYGDREKV